MSSDPSEHRSKADADLEREIRAERPFSLAEAIGRMAGPRAMKGASPVTRQQQAGTAIQEYLDQHLSDASGVLPSVLLRQMTESEFLLHNLDLPLVALAGHVRRVLDSTYLLGELVREADVEWGRTSGERPHFDLEGRPPDPDGPYTAESVRTALSQLVGTLNASGT